MPVVPSILNKVYEGVALPKCLYGMEVVPINERGLEEIEKAHRGMSKLVQNLPTNTPNSSHLAVVGWHTLDTRISIMKLSFLWRILCLPIDNIYRRIITFVLQLCLNDDNYVNLSSPTYSIFTYVRRYNLIDVLNGSLYSDNEGQISAYKKIIKNTVYSYETNCWKATIFLFHKGPLYNSCVMNIQMHAWWLFAKSFPSYYRQVSSVIALFCGTQPKFSQCNFDNLLCELCCERQLDNPLHVLFECSSLEVLRNISLCKIRLCHVKRVYLYVKLVKMLFHSLCI